MWRRRAEQQQELRKQQVVSQVAPVVQTPPTNTRRQKGLQGSIPGSEGVTATHPVFLPERYHVRGERQATAHRHAQSRTQLQSLSTRQQHKSWAGAWRLQVWLQSPQTRCLTSSSLFSGDQ